ncbi:class I SAM-dependent methyltransferase [Nocardiopsis rhodophaea]
MAESFGSDAERYDRARPRYPEAMVERIATTGTGSGVLDVGTGTGIAARQFQAIGCTVLGVEPDARMADMARQLGVEVDVATFEDWDPAGRQFDAVVAAQAWHWIDPVAGAAKAARVLRPGGTLAAFWNVFQFPPEVVESFAEVFRREMPDSPFPPEAMLKQPLESYQELFDKAAQGIRDAGGFGGPEQWRYDWEWTYTRDAWLDQMPTLGNFTRLPSDVMDKLLDGIGAAVDAIGGSFTMGYATVVVAATRS